MNEVHRDFDREFLDLLKYNYDNLHKSFWEAHRISWIMTGIFIPIIFTAIGYFIKEQLDIYQTSVGAIIIIAVIWFWYGMLTILRNYNSTRKDQLEKIERTLNKYYSPHVQQKETEFKQYDIEYKKGGIGFMPAARLFALFISGVAGATLFIKVCQSLCKSNNSGGGIRWLRTTRVIWDQMNFWI